MEIVSAAAGVAGCDALLRRNDGGEAGGDCRPR
jgi:hypothetical protein